MKEIIAVVRMNKTGATKKSLVEAGVAGFTAFKVEGRCKRKLTGTPGGSSNSVTGSFEDDIKAMIGPTGIEANVKSSGDLFTLHHWIKNQPVDLLMGTTYGKYIARADRDAKDEDFELVM